MFNGLIAILLLSLANVFMIFAWCGHLEMKQYSWFASLSVFQIILLSWGIAFFEYLFQIPANRIGIVDNGGPFNLFELKLIQEIVSLVVFLIIAVFVFKTEKFAWNHVVGFLLMALSVFFIFKKW